MYKVDEDGRIFEDNIRTELMELSPGELRDRAIRFEVILIGLLAMTGILIAMVFDGKINFIALPFCFIPGWLGVVIFRNNVKIKPSSKMNTSPNPVVKKIISRPGFNINIGTDLEGTTHAIDIRNLLHILVAGTTGSGKSVFINNLICKLIKINPNRLKLILIDRKGTEFMFYEDVPHLLTEGILSDTDEIKMALAKAVMEMEMRYTLLKNSRKRDIVSYNKEASRKLEYIYIIVDELADLMIASEREDKKLIEKYLILIAQKSRACGIFLILATQRPSADVVTPLIKANIPSRIAFNVTSETNSKIILDTSGAELLKGKGDMLYKPVGKKMMNLQGFFISDSEVDKAIQESIEKYESIKFKKWMVHNQGISTEDHEIKFEVNDVPERKIINLSEIYKPKPTVVTSKFSDELSEEILAFIVSEGRAVKSRIKTEFKLGYERIDKILAEFKEMGILGEREKANEPYPCLITYEEWKQKYVV